MPEIVQHHLYPIKLNIYVKSTNTINLDRLTSFKLRVDKYSVSYICLNFYEEKENRKLWHYCLWQLAHLIPWIFQIVFRAIGHPIPILPCPLLILYSWSFTFITRRHLDLITLWKFFDDDRKFVHMEVWNCLIYS